MVVAKLHQIMSEIGSIGRDSVIETKKGNYSVRSEEAVLRAIRPMFIKHGLVLYPVNIASDRQGQLTRLTIEYRIEDTEDGDAITTVAYGEGYDTADKGAGKALTYATKNMLIKLVLAVSGEDTDNKASETIVEEETELTKKFDEIIGRLSRANIQEDTKTLLKQRAAKYQTDAEMLDNISAYLSNTLNI